MKIISSKCNNNSKILSILLLLFIGSVKLSVNDDSYCSKENSCPSENCEANKRAPQASSPACDANSMKRYQGLGLFKSFEDWANNVKSCQHVRETFPVDSIENNYVRQVKNVLYSKTLPTPLKTPVRLVAVSEDVMENLLDLNVDVAKQEFFRAFVSGNTVLQNVQALAHRYGGHQFGSWSGQLGDGRAHLLGEYTNRNNETWELQLKGSGLTPYSRRGDGRAVLRSSVREFLCSESMYYLNIPTSRALSLIVSDDPVIRDQFYDGHVKQERAAVVLRLASSWFRFGSIEILASNGEKDLLRKLVDFIIVQYFKEIDSKGTDKYLWFYSKVVQMTAELIAQWQSVGFAHGVMNTDNFSILSLTIDYGPFGFLDSYNPAFIPNYSDDEGRYSFENQPKVGLFNLERLQEALQILLPNTFHDRLTAIRSSYMEIYNSKWTSIHRQKLGLLSADHDGEEEFIRNLFKMMEETKSDFTMTFRQMSSLSLNEISSASVPESLWALQQLQKHIDFKKWMLAYAERLRLNGEEEDNARQQRMNKINPRYILRNWMAQEAISKAEKNDFTDVNLLLKVLKNPYDEQKVAENRGWASRPPSWASRLKVSCSS